MATKHITDLTGVFAGAVPAGIKPGRDDLSYIFIPDAYSSAGAFTRSAFVAPCLTFTRKNMTRRTQKAVIVNAGCANAATGVQGYRNAEKTAKLAAARLGLRPDEVSVASTGIIGVQLPMEKMTAGIERMLQKPKKRNGLAAAKAILTTDLVKKETWVSGSVGQRRLTVAGFAKGSGMIAPNMATMLGFLVTDARVSSSTLRRMLRVAVDSSFNMTSVDTDTSTNDMVLIFSTGTKEVKSTRELAGFQALLTEACIDLAKQIAADGEGATKLIEVNVAGARSLKDARAIARNVSNSPLLKTAIHGSDPNWGRVCAAAGKDPALRVDPARFDLRFGTVQVMRRGVILPFQRTKVVGELKKKVVQIHIDLNLGKHAATAWGCDLTKGYVDINTAYN